jgi:hypothetical protein
MTTSETSQAIRAARFRALRRGTVSVLSNAWAAGVRSESGGMSCPLPR